MKFRGEAGETLWLLIGVVLLIGIMASFSPNSTFSKAFIGVRKSMEGMVGSGTGYCPFINPYALEIFSAGEIEIMGNHSLCDAVEYAGCQKIWGDNGDTSAISHCTTTVDENSVEIYKKKGCEREYGISITDDGKIKLTVGDNENVTDADMFFAALRDFERSYGDMIDNDNKIAIDLLMEKRPRWQCFLIFGFLPFLILYYLLNDILAFAFIRTNTRRLIAVFASLLTVMTGALANLVVSISSFVGLSTGVSFLMMIFLMAMLSMFLGQLTTTMGVVQSTTQAVQKVVTGALALSAVSEATREEK